jgi:hypothetical protein
VWSYCPPQETSFAFVGVSHKLWRPVHECMSMRELRTEEGTNDVVLAFLIGNCIADHIP